MSAIIRQLERFTRGIEWIAAVFLAAITLLIVASAIGRYIFAMPIPDAFDVSRLMLGVAIMWGFASVGFRGSHIKVDLVAELLPRGARRVCDFVAWSVLLGFTVLLSWKMLSRVLSAQASGEATFDLRLPAWPFLALICAGAAVSVVAVLARLIIIATGRGTLDPFEKVETGEEDKARDVQG